MNPIHEPKVGICALAEATGYSREYLRSLTIDGTIPAYQARPRANRKYYVSEVKAALDALRYKPGVPDFAAARAAGERAARKVRDEMLAKTLGSI